MTWVRDMRVACVHHDGTHCTAGHFGGWPHPDDCLNHCRHRVDGEPCKPTEPARRGPRKPWLLVAAEALARETGGTLFVRRGCTAPVARRCQGCQAQNIEKR